MNEPPRVDWDQAGWAGPSVIFGPVEYMAIGTPDGWRVIYRREHLGMKSIEVPDHLYDALLEMVATFIRKGQDYATSDEAWDSTFKFTAEMFGMERWEVADFNEAQKLARLSALRHRGRAPLHEPSIDSYRDKAVYALIAFALVLHHRSIAHPSAPQYGGGAAAGNDERVQPFTHASAGKGGVGSGSVTHGSSGH